MRICVSCDDILQKFTKMYRNNNENYMDFASDSIKFLEPSTYFGVESRGPPLSILVDVIRNHVEFWLDSLLILVYQIRVYISRDNILRARTKIYRKV